MYLLYTQGEAQAASVLASALCMHTKLMTCGDCYQGGVLGNISLCGCIHITFSIYHIHCRVFVDFYTLAVYVLIAITRKISPLKRRM
jgi:hypothetical protein